MWCFSVVRLLECPSWSATWRAVWPAWSSAVATVLRPTWVTNVGYLIRSRRRRMDRCTLDGCRQLKVPEGNTGSAAPAPVVADTGQRTRSRVRRNSGKTTILFEANLFPECRTTPLPLTATMLQLLGVERVRLPLGAALDVAHVLGCVDGDDFVVDCDLQDAGDAGPDSAQSRGCDGG